MRAIRTIVFHRCIVNTTLPEESYIFYNLFNGNASLTDASGLLLPATTLQPYCYASMFYNCTALTAGPTLPATTLAYCCYEHMFYRCSSLTSLTCLATDISASDCIRNWLDDVEAEGTLYVDPTMTTASWGIPSLWNVK